MEEEGWDETLDEVSVELDEESDSLRPVDVPVFGLPEGATLHLPNHPSLTRILRDVKRQEHSPRNCVASIVYDARMFVARLPAVFPGWSIFGNKRCGAWYVPPDGSDDVLPKQCYFKSTDGHVNKWGFSFARLNLHVALDAARHGGCIVVDATRRGKMFPDALSKTVPIWCAVVNTAVALYRMDTVDVDDESSEGNFAQISLQLPPWVPDGEAAQIEARIDAWAMQLVDAGIEEFATLAREMSKPLVCIWAHPSHDRLPEVDDAMRERSTVVVLASASVYGSRERRAMRLDNGEEVVFSYVAGAADDEETWGQGLTPELMWAWFEQILMEEDGNGKFVKGLVAREGSRGHKGTSECGLGEETGQSVFTRIVDGEDNAFVGIASHAYVLKHGDGVIDGTTAVFNVSSCDLGNYVGCEPCTLIASSTLTAGAMQSKECRVAEIDGSHITRYCWVKNAASRKHPVVEYAPCSVTFASHHLQAGHSVLFVYDADTSSISVALLLASMIALFTLEDNKFRRISEGYTINAGSGSVIPAIEAGTRVSPGSPGSFSREVFRRYVANVTVRLPHVVMRKAILKQVFNVFVR